MIIYTLNNPYLCFWDVLLVFDKDQCHRKYSYLSGNTEAGGKESTSPLIAFWGCILNKNPNSKSNWKRTCVYFSATTKNMNYKINKYAQLNSRLLSELEHKGTVKKTASSSITL